MCGAAEVPWLVQPGAEETDRRPHGSSSQGEWSINVELCSLVAVVTPGDSMEPCQGRL